MSKFAFKMNGYVTLALSGEEGVVVGRAEYRDSERQYFVRYLSADGRQVEGWWPASALSAD